MASKQGTDRSGHPGEGVWLNARVARRQSCCSAGLPAFVKIPGLPVISSNVSGLSRESSMVALDDDVAAPVWVVSGEPPAVGPDALARGEARYRAGDYAAAADIFASARDADPRDPAATRLLGLCRLRLGDLQAAGLHAAGRHADAAAQFRASAQLVPNDPASLARGEHRKALAAGGAACAGRYLVASTNSRRTRIADRGHAHTRGAGFSIKQLRK
jgi:tetratricopeptide (TPR) repeat protein